MSQVKQVLDDLAAKGVTPQHVAEQLDVHWRTVYRWKKGDTTPQRRRDWEKLASLAQTHGLTLTIPTKTEAAPPAHS